MLLNCNDYICFLNFSSSRVVKKTKNFHMVSNLSKVNRTIKNIKDSFCKKIDLMHNDVTRLDAREECWS